MNSCISQPPYLVLCYGSLAYYYRNTIDLKMTIFLVNNMAKMMSPIVIDMNDDIAVNNLADNHRNNNKHRRHLAQSPNPNRIDENQHVMDIYSIVFLDQSVYNPAAFWFVFAAHPWFEFRCREPVKYKDIYKHCSWC